MLSLKDSNEYEVRQMNESNIHEDVHNKSAKSLPFYSVCVE